MKKTPTLKYIDDLCCNFLSQLHDALKFQIDIPKTIELYQDKTTILVEALELVESENSKLLLPHFKDELKYLENHPPIVNIMSVVYGIAHFEAYFNDLTNIMLKYYWQTLRTSGKTLTYEEILRYESIDELKNGIIDKELMIFSHLGIDEKIKYYENKFKIQFSYARQKGVRINWNCIEREELISLFATRNIILHNGGYINKIYKRITKSDKYKIGDKVVITDIESIDMLGILLRVGRSLSAVCRNKIKE
jgi:hypothetical protein